MILTGSTWQKLRHVHEDGRVEVVYFLVIKGKVFARINGMRGNQSRLYIWQVMFEAWLKQPADQPAFTSSGAARVYVDAHLRKLPESV